MRQNSTRSIVINSAEEPDYIPNPQLDPVGYDWRRERHDRKRRRPTNWRLFVVLAIPALIGLILSCLFVRAFVEYRYEYDYGFRSIVNTGMNLATAAIFFAIAAIAIAIVVLLINLAIKAGIIELPGGMIAHIFDLVFDWQRSGSREIVKWSIDRHFDVQTILAQQSLFRNVTTYSPSRSIDVDSASSGDGMNIPIPIPSFHDLMNDGQIGASNGLMLGVSVEGGIV